MERPVKSKNDIHIPRHLRGVGVDIEEVGRFRKIMNNKNLLSKIFTGKEVKYCKRFSSPEHHLAARFAGKEAVFKALGGGNAAGGKVAFNEIEILNRRDGSPFVEMKRKKLKNKFIYFISLAHSKTKAIAFAVIKEKV